MTLFLREVMTTSVNECTYFLNELWKSHHGIHSKTKKMWRLVVWRSWPYDRMCTRMWQFTKNVFRKYPVSSYVWIGKPYLQFIPKHTDPVDMYWKIPQNTCWRRPCRSGPTAVLFEKVVSCAAGALALPSSASSCHALKLVRISWCLALLESVGMCSLLSHFDVDLLYLVISSFML